MDGMQEILFRLDAIEVLVIKAAGTASVLVFCFYMIRSHIRDLHNTKQKVAKKGRSKNQP